LLAASGAEVDMMTGWPLGGLLEERVDEIKLAKGYMEVTDAGQPMTEDHD
jgi:hypothetical protein